MVIPSCSPKVAHELMMLLGGSQRGDRGTMMKMPQCAGKMNNKLSDHDNTGSSMISYPYEMELSAKVAWTSV